MLKIEDLPQKLTPHDVSFINEKIRDINYSDKLYSTDNTFLDVTIDSISDDLIANLTASIFSISHDNCKQFFQLENVDMKEPNNLAFLPTTNSEFQSYKSELEIIPFFIDGKLNVGSELLFTHLWRVNNFVSQDVIEAKYSKDNYLVICPITSSYIYFNESIEHPFEIEVNGDSYHCDSLDLALKVSYELAVLEKGYKSKSLRELQEKLNSPEELEAMDKFITSLNEENDRLKAFFHSNRKEELFTLIKEELAKEGAFSINCGDFYHEEAYDFMTFEDFDKLVSSVFLVNDSSCDEDATFSTSYVNVDGLHFERVDGQGSIYSISLID